MQRTTYAATLFNAKTRVNIVQVYKIFLQITSNVFIFSILSLARAELYTKRAILKLTNVGLKTLATANVNIKLLILICFLGKFNENATY